MPSPFIDRQQHPLYGHGDHVRAYRLTDIESFVVVSLLMFCVAAIIVAHLASWLSDELFLCKAVVPSLEVFHVQSSPPPIPLPPPWSPSICVTREPSAAAAKVLLVTLFLLIAAMAQVLSQIFRVLWAVTRWGCYALYSVYRLPE